MSPVPNNADISGLSEPLFSRIRPNAARRSQFRPRPPSPRHLTNSGGRSLGDCVHYNVPDVPWVLYFTNSGHALHGTYWHNNFGTPMSHGCINLPMDVAAWLYDWAPLGTPVLVVQ